MEGVIVSAFDYAGQKCSACSRVIVMDTVYDQFLRRLTQAAASLKIGDPADPGTRVGPVISAEAREGILSYIEQGASRSPPGLSAGRHALGPAGAGNRPGSRRERGARRCR